jgi:hypothetical protein
MPSGVALARIFAAVAWTMRAPVFELVEGLDACRQRKAALPAVGIVMLTALDDPEVRDTALAESIST